MSSQKLNLALSRSDLSQWLIHLSRPQYILQDDEVLQAEYVLHDIISEEYIRPSLSNHITRYCKDGAACFYDVPPAVWPEIIKTSPTNRQGFGIIVERNALWHMGGRPVIYTDVIDPDYWPEQERYRLVYTNLTRKPYPADWTHEREWRIRGGLSLASLNIIGIWWWPVVPSDEYLPNLWRLFPGIVSVYVISKSEVVQRPYEF